MVNLESLKGLSLKSKFRQSSTAGNAMQIGRPMAIVGTSLGGAVAIDFAVAHPEAVAKLVLLAPQVNYPY